MFSRIGKGIWWMFPLLLQVGGFAECGDMLGLLDRYEIVFSKIPRWEKGHAKLEPFGNGSTNQNYRLTIDGECYFIRVGSPGRELLGLTSAKEYSVMRLANTLDLTPPILVADLSDEILVMPFIETKFVDLHDKETLFGTVKLLKKLHQSKNDLLFSATPEEIIAFYLAKIEELQIPLTADQLELIHSRPRLAPVALVPCHLDLHRQNVLDDGTRLWLIDWEYGAMSDPLFDLASLASADFFTDEEMDALLDFYEKAPSEEMRGRLKKLRILADLRWALWSLIQMRTATLDFPYEEWAESFFNQVKIRM